MPSSPSASPSMLSMIAAPTVKLLSPSGQPRMARRCCSYLQVIV